MSDSGRWMMPVFSGKLSSQQICGVGMERVQLIRSLARIAFSAALLLVPLMGAESTTTPEAGRSASDATVCQLVQTPKEFKGRVVRVWAIVESDLIEHTMLIDGSCGSAGIFLWIPHEADNKADFRELRQSLKDRWKPGVAKTRITATFTGTFSLEGKRRFLKAWKVENVEVGER